MNAVFTPARTKITIERYQKMVATGVLTKDDRIELIEGEMLDMAPIGPKHATITDRLARLFNLAVQNAAIVSPGRPVNLGHFSDPQPDLMLLKPRADGYSNTHPEAADVLLLIEVSDSTLTFDRSTKLSLYARYGVPEYWVIDVNSQRIFAYHGPTQNTFQHTREYGVKETISSQAFPDIKIAIRELFV